MKTLHQLAEQFWKNHEDHLKQWFPGLNPERIIREWSFFYRTKPDEIVLGSLEKAWKNFTFELLSGKPLAYINGTQSFWGIEFTCDESTLIPRPETEELVELALAWIIQQKRKLQVIDVGCGSGAIGLTLLSQTSEMSSLVLTDISHKALSLAHINSQKLRYRLNPAQIDFWRGDRLKNFPGKADLIVSNPPYIPLSFTDQVHAQVQNFEPSSALFIPDEEYFYWFETFFQQVEKILNPQGFFIMEGHENHLPLLKDHFSNYGFQLKKDIRGQERFLYFNS